MLDQATLNYLGSLIICCMAGGFIGTLAGAAIGHLVLFIGGKIRKRKEQTE